MATDKYPASVGCLIRGDCGVIVAHDDGREQGYDNGRVTPGGVIVVAAFAMVLVSVNWVGVAVAPRVAGVVHVLDVLGEVAWSCRLSWTDNNGPRGVFGRRGKVIARG